MVVERKMKNVFAPGEKNVHTCGKSDIVFPVVLHCTSVLIMKVKKYHLRLLQLSQQTFNILRTISEGASIMLRTQKQS